MKAHILYIGIIDNAGQSHSVSFKQGVNVVTGRSSTGKSALIEIFDYCFGSSDFTVPVGVITDCASVYFSILKVEESLLVIGRHKQDSRGFLKEEIEHDKLSDIESLTSDYFEDEYYYPLPDYLKELRQYFNIDITDIDEDTAIKEWRGKKASSPSIRSFTSFMLQHQNLVANKHALFYRFDQKQKRDQVIDHLKVFLGFADQEYFSKSQKLSSLEQQKRILERAIPRKADRIKLTKLKLENEQKIYESITGIALDFTASEASKRPKSILKQLTKSEVKYESDSDLHVKLRTEAIEQQSILTAELRQKQIELADIYSSIRFTKQYAKHHNETVTPATAELHAESCPFCFTEMSRTENYANELSEAIEWLNSELSQSSYRLASLEEAKEKKLKEISLVRESLFDQNKIVLSIENQIKDLKAVKDQYELALKSKLKIENFLEDISNIKSDNIDEELTSLQQEIDNIARELARDYDIKANLEKAQLRINHHLSVIGKLFEFESSYDPINLKFSIESFDLWHEEPNGKQVYLRSMGSGANWLSCHLVLFLSLHRYFSELGDECSIPPILFFDQPSQVYFPSILDGGEEFSASELASKDSSRDQSRDVDEDIRAVTNLFTQLVEYCKTTKEKTNISPQIIITDHADHLKLGDGVDFESLVRARWRGKNEGFISD